MNKLILLTVTLSLMAMCATAQVRIGPKIGGNLSNFAGDDKQFYVENSQYKLGFNGGFAANFPLFEFLSLQPEFLYSQQGALMNEEEDFSLGGLNDDWEVRTDMHYLKTPLLAKLAVGGEEFKVFVEGGAYGAYLVASSYSGGSKDEFADAVGTFYPDPEEQYKDWDFGYAAGFGFQFTVNEEDHFLVNLRFSRSFNTITKEIDFSPVQNIAIQEEFEQYNQVFTFSFTYLLSTGS